MYQEEKSVIEDLARPSKVDQAISNGATSVSFGKDPDETFSHKMLTFPLRQYVIDKCKAPIHELLLKFARRWPEPTRQNCHHPNTLVWFDIWDKFLAMEDNPCRTDLFWALRRIFLLALEDALGWASYILGLKKPCLRAIKKIFNAEYEHDHSYYGVRIDVILEMWLDEVLKGNYKPRSLDYPNQCWKVDPNVRGPGFELIKASYYRKKAEGQK